MFRHTRYWSASSKATLTVPAQRTELPLLLSAYGTLLNYSADQFNSLKSNSAKRGARTVSLEWQYRQSTRFARRIREPVFAERKSSVLFWSMCLPGSPNEGLLHYGWTGLLYHMKRMLMTSGNPSPALKYLFADFTNTDSNIRFPYHNCIVL